MHKKSLMVQKGTRSQSVGNIRSERARCVSIKADLATIGRQATCDSVAGFFSSINGLRHTVIDIFQQENVITVELSIDYTRKDGKVVTLPCANIFRMEGPLVRDYRVFMDVTPIFA